MKKSSVLLILLVALSATSAVSDAPFIRIDVDGRTCFIVPPSEACKLRAQLDFLIYAKDFWTPTKTDIALAERASRARLRMAVSSPEKAFPGLAAHQGELAVPTMNYLRKQAAEIDKTYATYQRQFLGWIRYDGKKFIYCNYSLPEHFDAYVPKEIIQDSDPARAFIQMDDGGAGFWQTSYDCGADKCDDLSINSSP